jgi:hypothetical protein
MYVLRVRRIFSFAFLQNKPLDLSLVIAGAIDTVTKDEHHCTEFNNKGFAR